MKKLLGIGLLALAATLVGCGDGLTNKQETCLEHMEDSGRTDGWEVCVEGAEYREHERAMARIENYNYGNVVYDPVQPNRDYVDYYGNENHGYWDNQGIYRFNDPYSSYAQSTNSYLLAAGFGGLAGYVTAKAATRSNWQSQHTNGWQSRSTSSTKYIGKGGKEISKSEFDRRKAQSEKDRKAHQQKLKKENKSLKSQLAKEKAKNSKGKQDAKKQSKSKPKANATKPKQQKKPLNLNKPKPKPKKVTKPKQKKKVKKSKPRKKK